MLSTRERIDSFWTDELSTPEVALPALPAGPLSWRLHRSRSHGEDPLEGLIRPFGDKDLSRKTYVLGHVLAGRRYAHHLGSAQGWAYHERGYVLLWECGLAKHLLHGPQDPANLTAWTSFETFLTRRFGLARILTPGWEPDYSAPTWQRALSARGYTPLPDHPRVWEKLVGKLGPGPLDTDLTTTL